MHNHLIRVDAVSVPGAWMIGHTTRATDRYTPDVELIRLKPKNFSQKHAHLWIDHSILPQYFLGNRIQKLAQKLSASSDTLNLNGVLCDLRFNSPENWAHSIFYHIPFCCKIMDIFGNEVTFILPEKLNKNIVTLFNIFEINFIRTNKSVSGNFILNDMDDFEIIIMNRREWMKNHIDKLFKKLDFSLEKNHKISKIFINRRTNRKIIGDNVGNFLKSKGYTEIFPEDYNCINQVSIFDSATHIVGIHGAGLAPLIYNRAPLGEKRLVGLMPPTQVTAGFRLLCSQVGVEWIGVRGEVSPKVARLCSIRAPLSTDSSYEDFSVCIGSLEHALKLEIDI